MHIFYLHFFFFKLSLAQCTHIFTAGLNHEDPPLAKLKNRFMAGNLSSSFRSNVPAYSGDSCEPILSVFVEYDTPALLLLAPWFRPPILVVIHPQTEVCTIFDL